MALLNRLLANIKPTAIVVGLIICALYSHLYVFKAHLEIDIETESPLRTMLRVYWAESDDRYVQGESAAERVTRGRKLYTTFLGNLSGTDRLRIDPIEFTGKVVIRELRITQPGFKPIALSTADLASQLIPVQQITDLELLKDGIVFNTTGADAQFELAITAERSEPYLLRWFLVLLMILVLTVVSERCLRRYGKDHGWVVIGLLLALVLAVAMAALSRYGTHPDEYIHWQAVLYYMQNLLPPPLDSPDIAGTYSIYGYSRLANFEIFYQLAGYAGALLQDLRVPDYLKARLFNCLLFLALVLFAARNKDFRIVAIPLLISAQVWYLFSYINSDALGLFIGMLAAYQAVSRQSLLNRILSEPDPALKWPLMIGLGLFFGLLLVVKTNYYFLALMIGLYFFWRMWIGDFSDRRQFWVRSVVIGVFAVVPYGARLAMDMHANGFSASDRSAIRLAMNEKYAQPQFKPSTPVAEKHIYLDLKERGFSVKRMLHRELWHTKARYSSFGVFGYTQFFASHAFYAVMTTLALLLMAVILVSILLRGPPASHVLFCMTGAVAAALVVALFWYSWSISFQPQGRYFAAILPMFSILLFEVRRYLIPKVFEGLVLAMFIMSAYAFLFVGVQEIQKIDTVINVFS